MIPYGYHWIDDEDIKAVVEVLRSGRLTQGPKVEEFEHKLAARCGARYAVAVANGTAALHLAALAAGIRSGDEAITSTLTFVASANCVLYSGGRPVLVDVCEETGNIGPEEIKMKVNQKTKAIIPVHFAGQACEMEKISAVAKEHGLVLIEDACHALGAEYRVKEMQEKWVKVGSCTHSDMTVMSFHPVKHITTGEGGAILTNRVDLYEKLLMLRSHGITKDPSRFMVHDPQSTGSWYYEMQELGFNYRITDIQSALGISQLGKLSKFIERRRNIAARYNQEFSQLESVLTPRERPEAKSAWHIYCLKLKDSSKRKAVFEALLQNGLGVQVHYIPIHLQPYYQRLFHYKEGDFPIAESIYRSSITLPLYPKMTDEDVDHVIRTVKKVVGKI